MNADARVMEFYPGVFTPEQTKAMVEKIESSFEAKGFGLWALETLATKEFIGYVGFSEAQFESPFTPCIEIGWRLAYRYWGQGYAPEAAREVLRDGFDRLAMEEIVSFTSVLNTKSIRVMEKIGMKRYPKEDFLHPALEDNHRLKPHVLYRLSKADWRARKRR
jgi:RimJ/RimL family protein N-acetyltransferase